PPTGDQNYRAINVSADGQGSVVNLSALTSFVDNYAGSTTGGNRYSTLTATHGGTVLAPLLTTLTGVAVTLDGTGTLTTAPLTTLTVDALTLSGAAAYDFSSLTSATFSVITVNGSTPNFAHLSDIDGTSIFVSGGVTVALPG